MTLTNANRRRGSRVLLALLSLVMLGATAAAAPAAPKPRACWNAVLQDWFVDGRIDGTYQLHCYKDAEAHLGEDARQYSSFVQDANRAMLVVVRNQNAHKSGTGTATGTGASSGTGTGTTQTGGVAPGGGDGSGTPPGSGGTPPPKSPHKGPITRAIDWLGPSNANSIPIPLLVLGGIAILLLLGAAASWFARRYQSRRLRPVPQPQQPPEQP